MPSASDSVHRPSGRECRAHRTGRCAPRSSLPARPASAWRRQSFPASWLPPDLLDEIAHGDQRLHGIARLLRRFLELDERELKILHGLAQTLESCPRVGLRRRGTLRCRRSWRGRVVVGGDLWTLHGYFLRFRLLELGELHPQATERGSLIEVAGLAAAAAAGVV